MSLRSLGFLLLVLVGLTACGGEPEQEMKMDRRFLTGDALEAQLASIREGIAGEVIDAHQWVQGEEDVYTLLSREKDPAEGYYGLYLRHYRVGKRSVPELLWTYQDSVACAAGAGAGAGIAVSPSTPGLRPAQLTPGSTEQFVLSYEFRCGGEAEKTLVAVNASSGTPDVRLTGNAGGLRDASDLIGLPEDTIRQLLAYWE